MKKQVTVAAVRGESDPVDPIVPENPMQVEQATRTRTARKRKRSGNEPTPQETVVELSCGTGFPPVRGRKTRPCRICGFVIKKRTAKQEREGVCTMAV